MIEHDPVTVNPPMPTGRLFAGCYPCEIVYADRAREVGGDYKRLAFLSYRTLVLEVEDECPEDLRRHIVQDAARYQAMPGEPLQISTCGQTITLGSALGSDV
jgi:hypothetical protein